MFGSTWGFTRPKKGEQPPPRRESLPPRMADEAGRLNSCPDESFDVGNDSTIYLSKKELGEFGKLGGGKLTGKVEIYDKDDDQRSLTLTVSPPSTTTSSATNNTESHRFWINCLKENGVLDLSIMSGHYAASSCAPKSPAHMRYLAAIRSPDCNSSSNNASPLTPKDYNASKRGIFAASRDDDSQMLPMNETEETASNLSSKLSYSPSSIGVSAAVDYILGEEALSDEKVSRPGCFLTECLRVPSYYDDDDDDGLDICRPPSEDSLAIQPLPSDITLKTKITAATEESDDYTDGDKKISCSGSMSTNTTPCSLDEQLSNTLEHVPFTEGTTRDDERDQYINRKDPPLEEYRGDKIANKSLAATTSTDEVGVDQLHDKIGDSLDEQLSNALEHIPFKEGTTRDGKHDQHSNRKEPPLEEVRSDKIANKFFKEPPLEEVRSDKIANKFFAVTTSKDEFGVDQLHDKIGDSLDEQLSNELEHIPFKEGTTRDGKYDQHSNRKEPPLEEVRSDKTANKFLAATTSEDEFGVDQLHDKIGDMSLTSTAPAAVVEATKEEFDAGKDERVTCCEDEKDESFVVEPEEDFEWAYNLWKSKGLMKTSSPRFQYVKDRRKSSGGKIKRTSTGSYKSVDLYKQTLESPGEELIDPECLVTPTDSQSTFGFQDFDDDTPESASVKGARRCRLSFPLSRPSVKKLQDGKSFANVMQMWKQKSDDKPNNHFLSPEQNIPASDYKVQSAEQKRAATVNKGQFDRKDVVKMKYHNRASQHATLVSVTSMVSTVSSQLTGATSYEADHPLNLNESDCQSVFSMSDNRSYMTSDSSRDGTQPGSVTLRYLRPTKDVTEQPVQRRSPPARGTSIDEQLMMPLPRRMSSGGRSKSRRASQRRRGRLSDPMIPPRRGQSGESSDFTKATSPRDHFRRYKSPPKSRGDYKTVVQTFLGQVNEHRDDASNTSHTPPRESRTNCSHMPPLPEAGGRMEEVMLESIEPVAPAASMDSYQLHHQPYYYDLSQNQSCESSSSFGGGSFSWRFDSFSQNQSCESAFESNKFPFALEVVDEKIQSNDPVIKSSDFAHDSPTQQNQRTEVEIGGRRFDRGHGPVIVEESGEDSGFGADTSMPQEANASGKKSPMPPLARNRVTPRDVQDVTKSARFTNSITDDSPWTKHILQNLEDSQGDEKHISPREDSKERPWRSDLVFERACHIGDQSIMSESNSNGKCNCASSVFSGNDELIEFFLPQMGMACTCGRRPVGLVNKTEPTALENILRPWQVLFLAGFGINRGDQLVKAHHRSANALASALRQYRRKQEMTPFRTKSCGMALQIWAKTCKAYVRSIRKQLTSGTTELKVPNTLYILSSFLERMHEDQTQSVAPTPPPQPASTGRRSDEDGDDPVQSEI